jgi:thiol-disulfide isomerase/thioredoxin
MGILGNPAALLTLVVVLGAALAAAWWLKGSGGRLSSERGPVTSRPTERLAPEDLGSPLGERATLVQFSTAFCQPCRATRRILTDVSGAVPGVAHVEVDAESHLDLVRRLHVRRTPTVLVLDAEGRIVRRASGQPRRADVVAALGGAVGDS